MERLILGSGLLRRGKTLLLVRSRYAREPLPLWTLPGGRQELGETIAETIAREFLEETSLTIRLGKLAYVSESVDTDAGLHVVNCTFWVSESDPTAVPHSKDSKVVETQFAPVETVPALLRADVLRIPVAAALNDGLDSRYYSFNDQNVVIPFFTRDV